MRLSVPVLVIVMLGLVVVPQARAQSGHAASQEALDAALQEYVDAAAAQRADVLRVLGHPAVRAEAQALGLDLRRAASAVATLEGAELADLAAQAGQVDEALAGGQSRITLSTTAIIIGLLLLILIIVAVS